MTHLNHQVSLAGDQHSMKRSNLTMSLITMSLIEGEVHLSFISKIYLLCKAKRKQMMMKRMRSKGLTKKRMMMMGAWDSTKKRVIVVVKQT